MPYQSKKTYPRRYHPMLVSNDGTDEKMDGETSLALWEAFNLLPEDNRKKVAADQVAYRIAELQQKFGFNDVIIGQITLLVRRVFFGEIDRADLETKLASIFVRNGIVDNEKVTAAAQFVRNEIFDIKLGLEEKIEEEKTESLSITDALLKFPKISDQLLTKNYIKSPGFLEPVRPSVKNWISDFRENMGSIKHSPMDRGNFLFHSANCKGLSASERQKLGLVLRSLDEQSLLTINPTSETIVFAVPEEAQDNSKVIDLVPAKKIPAVDIWDKPPVARVSHLEEKKSPREDVQVENFLQRSAGLKESYVPAPRVSQPITESAASDSSAALKNISFSPNFAAKTKIPTAPVESDVAKDAAWPSAMLEVNNRSETDIKNEKSASFFLPQSKPQIGSDDYSAATQNDGAKKQPVESHVHFEEESDIKIPENMKDRDSMSDDMLFKSFRKIKAENNKFASVQSGFTTPETPIAKKNMDSHSEEDRLAQWRIRPTASDEKASQNFLQNVAKMDFSSPQSFLTANSGQENFQNKYDISAGKSIDESGKVDESEKNIQRPIRNIVDLKN